MKDIPCDGIERRNKSAGVIIKKILWFLSIARNAIIVLITSFIAFTYHENGESLFKPSRTATPGLPPISPPPFSTHQGNVTYTFPEMCSQLGWGIIVIPLIAVLANVAIAKAFGKF